MGEKETLETQGACSAPELARIKIIREIRVQTLVQSMSIFKRLRAGVRDQEYSYSFRHAGKTILRKTPFTTASDAERAERDHRKLLQAGKFLEAAAIRSRRPKADTTIGQILAKYEISPADAKPATRKANINSFKNLLRTVLGKDVDLDLLAASAINGSLAKTWFNIASQAVQNEQSQTAQGSVRRSANSVIAQAKSLFVPRALEFYHDNELELPNVQEFLLACKTRKFTKAIKTDYHAPAETVIQQTLKDWQALDDRDLFLVIGHSLSFGLRKGEIIQAKWNWHTTRDTVPCLDSSGDFKNGSGFLQVRALDPFYTIMLSTIEARKWRGEPDAFIIPGSDTYRKESIYRTVSHWMRARGWETQKTVHEFRAYSGSQVAMRYGIYDCSSWLRHSSVKVTEQAYSRYVKLFRPSDVTNLPSKWAEVKTAPAVGPFIPQVVPSAANA